MSISRDTFDPDKHYKTVVYHQDRDLLDSELNEQQAIQDYERQQLADALFKEGAILAGLDVTQDGANLNIGPGKVYLDGRIETVPGQRLEFDPAVSGPHTVFVERLRYHYGANQDAGLINPATGEPTAERLKAVLRLTGRDTTAETLPNQAVDRKLVPLYQFEPETGTVSPAVPTKSNLVLRDLIGTLPGNRITVSSITEDQLHFQAAEGLGSLLQNLAERTNDLAGSYLVEGLDTFDGPPEGPAVPMITNAGRAYVQGFRLDREGPTTTLVPVSTATKPVRGEQKTFASNQRRYPLNSQPLKQSDQVEAIVEIVANVTRGSVGGGEDTLSPNPVVNLLEVSQGATTFQQGTDWQQSGNRVDWLGTGNEPGIGTTYTVRWTYTKQMLKGVDYVDGGWFGEAGFPDPQTYYYVVTAFDGDSETGFDPDQMVSRHTLRGELNELGWLPSPGALGYRIYRSTQPQTNQFRRLAELGAGETHYIDDGVDPIQNILPPGAGTGGAGLAAVAQLTLRQGDGSLINFGRADGGDQPIDGSNCSVDYAYYLGRMDVLYATPTTIKRLEGAPHDVPKPPVAPEGTLALCTLLCPPNSARMQVHNIGLKRVTMAQLHDLFQDVEDLKYNDAQSQMNNDLQNRDAQSKKGIYSDDFSNDAQSDRFHPEWAARVQGREQWVTTPRTPSSHGLVVDPAGSDLLLKGSLALLPAQERILVAQEDWSEEKNINPYAVFDPPDPQVELTPNIGRRGQTGIAVTGSNFTPGTDAITVTCDGHVVASDVGADAVGRVQVSFVIPEAARNGDRIVALSDGSHAAQATLQINDPLVVTRIERTVINRTIIRHVVRPPEVATPPIFLPPVKSQSEVRPQIVRKSVSRKVWRWRRRSVKRDPLAQTFSFGKARVVSAVGLFFTQKEAAIPVTVQIRGVTTGLPNDVVLAETVLAPDEITLHGETKVVFDDPFYAEANTSYAVVLLTHGTGFMVRIATLGQAGQNGIITGQTYATGVLLESSNAETWTPLNGSDLTLRIYGYEFESSGVLRFQPLTGVQFSALNLDEYAAVPEGSGIHWEISLDGGQTWDALVPAEEEQLPNVASQVLVQARFEGSAANDSPALNYKDVTLLGYLNSPAGTYVSRENALTQGVASTRMYVQTAIPSAASVTWFASNDGGARWEAVQLEGTRPIDHLWTEYTLACTFTDPTGQRVRYKAEMTGTPLIAPRIHRFGATLS